MFLLARKYSLECLQTSVLFTVINILTCFSVSCVTGEILSALNETGLLGRTHVIFTADHGELAMEHRQFYKMSMYEPSSHVPLLIMGPNIKSQSISNMVSLVDIYPTMLGKQHLSYSNKINIYGIVCLFFYYCLLPLFHLLAACPFWVNFVRQS